MSASGTERTYGGKLAMSAFGTKRTSRGAGSRRRCAWRSSRHSRLVGAYGRKGWHVIAKDGRGVGRLEFVVSQFQHQKARWVSSIMAGPGRAEGAPTHPTPS